MMMMQNFAKTLSQAFPFGSQTFRSTFYRHVAGEGLRDQCRHKAGEKIWVRHWPLFCDHMPRRRRTARQSPEGKVCAELQGVSVHPTI
jgi:hypothetical protein